MLPSAILLASDFFPLFPRVIESSMFLRVYAIEKNIRFGKSWSEYV
jgi:hypothetical protein